MKRFKLFCQVALVGLSAALALFVLVCYAGRFDWCTAVTLYPAWCWFGAGMLILLPTVRSKPRFPFLIVSVLWLSFLTYASDTPLSMLRALLPEPQAADTIRVVSLNCAGEITAAREVIELNPDIVLFQETPRHRDVLELSKEMYGEGKHFLWYYDTSMIARSEIEQIVPPAAERGRYLHATLQLDDEQTLDVICLRFYPCPVRLDLWNLECWKIYRQNRERRRKQMSRLAKHLESVDRSEPLLVGGDFNAPPRDAVFRLLEPRLSEAFAAAGRGWGNSFMTGFRVIRIDQLWNSAQLKPVKVWTVPNPHSDHAIVVADFQLLSPRRTDSDQAQ